MVNVNAHNLFHLAFLMKLAHVFTRKIYLITKVTFEKNYSPLSRLFRMAVRFYLAANLTLQVHIYSLLIEMEKLHQVEAFFSCGATCHNSKYLLFNRNING